MVHLWGTGPVSATSSEFTGQKAESLVVALEVVERTPALLTPEGALVLPQVVVGREDNGPVTDLLADGVESLSLLLLARASEAVALATSRPAALKVDSSLAGADLLEDVDLTSDEVTSLGGRGVGVEESVDVGTDNVDGAAESSRDVAALVDVEGFGGGPGAVVARALGLDGLDESHKLARRACTAHDGLVTNDNELNVLPVCPGGDLVNLALDIGGVVAAAALDKETNNELHAKLLDGRSDALDGVAVSGVDAKSGDAKVVDFLNILHDLASRFAVTSGGLVRSVGHGVALAGVRTQSTVGSVTTAAALDGRLGLGGSGLGGRLGLGGGLGLLNLDLDLDLGSLGLLDLGSRGRRSLLGGLGSRRSGLLGAAEGAVDDSLVDGVSDRNGHGLVGVGAGLEDGRGGVVDIALGLDDRGGARNDGADTGLVADVGGDGGLSTVGLVGIGASDGGRALDIGGDLTVGVSAWGQVGGGGTADGHGLVDGDGLGRDGVGAGSLAGADAWDRDEGDLGRLGSLGGRRRRRSDVRGAGSGLGHGSVRNP